MGFLDSLFGKKKASGNDRRLASAPQPAKQEQSPQVPPSPRPASSAPPFTRPEIKIHPPGAVIANRYEVASLPLMGGMGIVYLCLDRLEDRPVALKTFRPEYLSDREARDRFLREGTTWVSLGRHAHIVRAYGVERVGDGREVYLVLELVAKEPGRQDASLRSWLRPGKPLPVDQALLFALQVARAMKHALGVIPGFVHRDLKPENLLVGADHLSGVKINRLRVTDLGLASALQAGGTRITTKYPQSKIENPFGRTQLTRGVVGTPLYMAPEQWKGEGVCVQTDMYALGCIIYEMVTGRFAAEGRSMDALKQAHCMGESRPLPKEAPGVVAEVVGRCLAKETKGRYRDWQELGAALGAAYKATAGFDAPEEEGAQALAISREIGDFSSLAITSFNIAALYAEQGEATRALPLAQEAARVFSQIGHAQHALMAHELVERLKGGDATTDS